MATIATTLTYTFTQRWISEMLAMLVVITIGDCVIANEVLARTKGHALGLGHVSVGFGMAFFTAIVMFGGISAACNPAMLLAKAFTGYLSWRDALLLMIADYIGAFLGAILVYLTYLPHFSLVPPAPQRPHWPECTILPPENGGTRAALISYDAHGLTASNSRAPVELRRRRVERKGSVEMLDIAESVRRSSFNGLSSVEERGSSYAPSADIGRPAYAEPTAAPPPPQIGNGQKSEAAGCGKLLRELKAIVEVHLHPGDILQVERSDGGMSTATDYDKLLGESDQLHRAYLASLLADQNSKLTCFCTRPAVYLPGLNFLCEVVGTFMLIWTVLMLELRVELLPQSAKDNGYLITQAFLIGFVVVGLIMGMAGPTGYAANPARDWGPRFAHFVLPIPNKGSSEWYYAPVPFFGSYVGGFLGALAFHLCRYLYNFPATFEGPENFGGNWNCAGKHCFPLPE